MMILNVNRYANVILERSLRANEGHIGVNESVLTIMKQIWTLMNGYFLEMNRCSLWPKILAVNVGFSRPCDPMPLEFLPCLAL